MFLHPTDLVYSTFSAKTGMFSSRLRQIHVAALSPRYNSSTMIKVKRFFSSSCVFSRSNKGPEHLGGYAFLPFHYSASRKRAILSVQKCSGWSVQTYQRGRYAPQRVIRAPTVLSLFSRVRLETVYNHPLQVKSITSQRPKLFMLLS